MGSNKSRLVLRCNYLKNSPARHKGNYIKYLGTRDGVELNPESAPRFFYEDVDMRGKKSNYVEYLAKRPGVEIEEAYEHGLFSASTLPINLHQVMDEVADHPGIVWENVISLHREDAARLGYDNLHSWQSLLRRHISDMATSFHIDPSELAWYAAFHNEGHHPHVHVCIFSRGKEGYLTKKGIADLKASLVRDVFRHEQLFLYTEKTQSRKNLKDRAKDELRNSITKMQKNQAPVDSIELKMCQLKEKLWKYKGKRSYAYMTKDIKKLINSIVDELERNPAVKECYEKWFRLQATISGYYGDEPTTLPPLSQNKEFRSIKNMIIREVFQMPDYGPKFFRSGQLKYSFTLRLLKALEDIFGKYAPITHTGGTAASDSKQLLKEKEKKVALGQKQDDGEDESQGIHMW